MLPQALSPASLGCVCEHLHAELCADAAPRQAMLGSPGEQDAEPKGPDSEAGCAGSVTVEHSQEAALSAGSGAVVARVEVGSG